MSDKNAIMIRHHSHLYHVFNEAETHVGDVHRWGDVDPVSNKAVGSWYGVHVTGHRTPEVENRHEAARQLMDIPGDVPPL